jgi:hypothetical protein
VILRHCIIGVMALCLTTSFVLAEDKQDVQQLYGQCKNIGDIDQMFCSGYIAGVTEQMTANGFMLNKNDKTLDRSLFLCAPPSTTLGAMVQAFVKWAENYPQGWGFPRQIGVMTALQKTWPCP